MAVTPIISVSSIALTASSTVVPVAQPVIVTAVADVGQVEFTFDQGDGSPHFTVPASNTPANGIQQPLIFSRPGQYVVTVTGHVIDTVRSVTSQLALTVFSPPALNEFVCDHVATPNETYFCSIDASGTSTQVAIDGETFALVEAVWESVGTTPASSFAGVALDTNPLLIFRLVSSFARAGVLRSIHWLGHSNGQCQVKLMRALCAAGAAPCPFNAHKCCSTTVIAAADSGTLVCPPVAAILCSTKLQCDDRWDGVCSSDTPDTPTYSQVGAVTIETGAEQRQWRDVTDTMEVTTSDIIEVECTTGQVASISATSGDLDQFGEATTHLHLISVVVVPSQHISTGHVCLQPMTSTSHSLQLQGPTTTATVTATAQTVCQIPIAGLAMRHVQQEGVEINVNNTPIYVSTTAPVNIAVAVEQGAPVSFNWTFGDPAIANISDHQDRVLTSETLLSVSVVYAQSGLFTLVCNATNLHSTTDEHRQEVVAQIAAQHPVLSDWALHVHSQSLIGSVKEPYDPAIVVFRIQQPADLQLPTDAFLVVDFGDGFSLNSPRALSEFGLTDSSGQELAQNGFNTVEIEHQYFSEGVYTINMSLYNEVSHHTMQTVVDIHEQIVDFQVTFKFQLDDSSEELEHGLGDSMNQFHNDKNVSFDFAMSQGTATHYIVYNTSREPMEQIHMFHIADKYNPTEGDYYWFFDQNQELNISVVAVDDFQISAPAEATLVITDPLQPVKAITIVEGVDVASSGQDNQVSVTFEAQSLYWLCLTIDYGDGSPVAAYGDESVCEKTALQVRFMPAKLENPMPLAHTYWSEGLFNITVYLINEISQVTDTKVVSILNFPCPRPDLKVIDVSTTPEKATSYFRSSKIIVETQTVLDCGVDLSADKLWQIVRVNESSGQMLEEISIEGILDTWNKSTLMIKQNFLDFGVYKLEYSLSLWQASAIKPALPFITSVKCFIKIGRSPLKAIIIEGSMSRVIRGWGQTLDLNPAENSIDPDDLNDKSFEIEWYCKQFGEEMSKNGSEYAVTSVVVTGGCLGAGPGKLNHTDGHFILETDILRPHGVDMVFILVVVVRKDGRRAETSLELEMVSGKPPILSIACNNDRLCAPTDGGVYINPTKRLGLVANCLEDCFPPMTYQWDVKGIENETSSVDIENLEQYLLSPSGYPELSLSPGLFGNYSLISKFQLRLLANNSNNSLKTGIGTFYLIINKPPDVQSSSCHIPQGPVRALVDLFTLNCQPARDPEKHAILRYTFHLEISNLKLSTSRKKILATSRTPSISMRLPYGNVTILYDAVDELGSTSTKSIVTIATEMPTNEEYDSIMSGKTFTDAVKLGNAAQLLMIMLAAESIREEAEWAQPGYVPPGMNAEDAQAAVSDQNANALAGLSNIPMDNEASLAMASSGMASVLSSSIGDVQATLQIDSNTRDMALNLAMAVADNFDQAAFATPDEMTGIVSDIGTTFAALSINQAVVVNDEQCDSVPKADMKRAVAIDYDTLIGDYDSETDIPDSSKQMACNVRNAVFLGVSENANNMENVLGKMKKSIMQNMIVGEEVRIEAKGGVSMKLKMLQNVSELDLSVEGSQSKVQFEQFCPTGNCSDSVGIEFAEMPTNMRLSSGGSKQVSAESSVISIEVRSRNHSVMSIDSLDSPVRIVIPRNNRVSSDAVSKSHNCTECPASSVFFNTSEAIKNKIIPIIYSEFTIERPGSSIVIEVMPTVNRTHLTVALLAVGYMPTLRKYDFARMVQEFPEEVVNETSQVTTLYRWFISGSKVGNRTGRAFLALAQFNERLTQSDIKNTLDQSSKQLSVNDTLSWNFLTHFYIRTFTAGCYYYNEENDEWTSYGMTVVSATFKSVTCESTHLSSFSSGMFVQPNVIDFSYVFAQASFTDNLTIYMTMISFGTMMIVLGIWARWRDRRDATLLGARPLEDNQQKDKYLYELIVFTGHKSNAATTSQVYFILSGSEDQTDVRTFGKGNRTFFRKGGKDAFVMSCPQPLGELNYIRLWHDNSGAGRYSSWHVLYLHVRDLQTNRSFTFVINNWLAIDEADGSVERIESVAGDKQLRAFSHLFSHSSQKNISDNHLWFSVFLRPPESRFTRLQRVACCFTLLFLSMMVNAMWYDTVPSKPDSGSLQFGPMSLSPEQIFVGLLSNLIIFPPSFLIVSLFRKSRARSKRKSHIDEALDKQPFGNIIVNSRRRSSTVQRPVVKSRRKKLTLPWWCTIIAWSISIVCLFGSAFITWSYGIQFGNEKTSKWLASLIISFFSSIMFVQPIKVFLIAMFVSGVFKSFKLDSDDIQEDEMDPTLCEDEEWLQTHYERNRITKNRIKPPDSATLAKMKHSRQKELEMNATLKEILSYLVYLLILYVLSYDNRDPNAFYIKQTLENSFIKPGDLTGFNTDMDFSKVRNSTRFWSWTRNVLLIELRAQTWYNGVSPPYGLRGFLDDRVHRIIGFAIMRQVRSKEHTCPLHPTVETFAAGCSGYTDVLSEDTRDFCVNWTHTGDRSQCRRPEYRYTTAKELQNLPYWANINAYGGGGYVLPLKGRSSDLYDKLVQLEKENWIDDKTRVVFIRFSVYNAQINLIGTVNIFVEQIPGGGLFPGWRIDGIRLIRHPTGFQWFTLAIELSYIAFVVYFIVRETRSIIRNRYTYFHAYWNYAELAIILLSLASVVVFAIRYWETSKILSTFQKSHGNAYVQLEYAKFLDDLFGYMLGAIVFISTIKFTKLLRFNRRIGTLSTTLKKCWEDLAGFLVIFVIIMMTFAVTFNLLLISHLREFSTVLSSLNQCFSTLMNRFNFDDIHNASRLATVVFILFAFISSLILVNLLLTIIIRAYKTIREDIFKQPNDFELFDYVKLRLLALIGPNRRRVLPQQDGPSNSSSDTHSLLNKLIQKMNNLEQSIDPIYFRLAP